MQSKFKSNRIVQIKNKRQKHSISKMGRGSGMEISSPPKISPREEKACFQEQSAHRRQGFSSHGLILR
jgi:hypothetical protein